MFNQHLVRPRGASLFHDDGYNPLGTPGGEVNGKPGAACM
jgi:hypothetical protein